ncbi:MAG: hypothetical protein JSR81_06890 [Proteobacteria bacterium]|nr:hypothetical protein [Pseudomonadota bacterium]
MLRRVFAILATSGILVLAATGFAAAASPKIVYKVDSVAASIKHNKLTIIAAGAVSTGGWSNARLRLKSHKPEGGVLEYELVATPPAPDAMVVQALIPVRATLSAKLPPYGVTQIKVDTETNSEVCDIRR